MAITLGDRLFTDSYAYDLDKEIISRGEIYDADVINQSIEMILSTSYGERLFMPFFGSEVPLLLWEQLSTSDETEVLRKIVESVQLWENRITIIESQSSVEILHNENALNVNIYYVINKLNITSTFKRKLIF